MKRSTIILLSFLAALVVAVTIVVLRADRTAENIVSERLTQLADEQHLSLSWSDLRIRLMHGTVRVDSLQVCLATADSLTGDTTFIALSVPRLDIGRIHWLPLLRHRIARIDRVRLTNAAVELTKLKDYTALSVDSLSLAAYDLSYNLTDSTFAYNDSVYLLDLGPLRYTSPDSLFAATVGHLSTQDAGSIVISNIAGGNTDRKEEHAVRMGKQEVTWARFNLSELRTSPVNIIRLALSGEVAIDSVALSGPLTDIYYDAHFPPKEPYPLPQESLAAIKMPLRIGQFSASLGKLHIGMTFDGKHSGALDLRSINARIANITNAPDSTMRTALTMRMGEKGKAHINTAMQINKRGTFTYSAELHELRGSDLAGLTEPMLGVNLTCNFHSITTRCKGDSETMNGTFCMLYDSLSIHVNDHGPMDQLSRFAWAVNAFAPIMLYNRNPRGDREEPKSFDVSATHDPMLPFPAYFLGVINDGMLQTILPFGMGKGMMNKQKPKQKKE